MTTRFLYQPHDGHTVCGVRAPPHREQVLRAGASRRQLLARRLRVFDFDFFFLGTATGSLRHSKQWNGSNRTTWASEGYRL